MNEIEETNADREVMKGFLRLIPLAAEHQDKAVDEPSKPLAPGMEGLNGTTEKTRKILLRQRARRRNPPARLLNTDSWQEALRRQKELVRKAEAGQIAAAATVNREWLKYTVAEALDALIEERRKERKAPRTLEIDRERPGL